MSLTELRPEKSHGLFWCALVLLTCTYFYLYDSWYLLRDVSWWETLFSSAQAWMIWLLLMPWLLRRLPDQGLKVPTHTAAVQQYMILSLTAVLISTLSQAWLFSDQPGITQTLWFCYLPANLKILVLVLLLPRFCQWLQQPADHCLELSCQNHRNQTVTLKLTTISHLSAEGNYLQIHSAGSVFTLRATLKAMEHQLKAAGFIRVHRSHLVNRTHIGQLKARCLTLHSGTVVPVGRSHRHNLVTNKVSDLSA